MADRRTKKGKEFHEGIKGLKFVFWLVVIFALIGGVNFIVNLF
ncbi:MAG: hypothetical protein CFH08_01559 [Alphaproteobacteria bacterium MarineAlpha3_Bin7]|nr:MAG: hypothetical protein CFH08_01559 [Alphaproteobacteria bacterium MarineAlpha3_Bin7]|tara:strand:+ start:1444 stop:1572 length:129 start_codon:yes stop_codon:yes gene_type:complete